MPEVIVTIARDKTFKWKPQTMHLLQLLKLFSALFAATAATNNLTFLYETVTTYLFKYGCMSFLGG